MPQLHKSILFWYFWGGLEWSFVGLAAFAMFLGLGLLVILIFGTGTATVAVVAFGIGLGIALLWFVRRDVVPWVGGASLAGAAAGAIAQVHWPLLSWGVSLIASLSLMALLLSSGQALWIIRWSWHPGWWALPNAGIVYAGGISGVWASSVYAEPCYEILTPPREGTPPNPYWYEGSSGYFGDSGYFSYVDRALACQVSYLDWLSVALLIMVAVSTVAPLCFVLRKAPARSSPMEVRGRSSYRKVVTIGSLLMGVASLMLVGILDLWYTLPNLGLSVVMAGLAWRFGRRAVLLGTFFCLVLALLSVLVLPVLLLMSTNARELKMVMVFVTGAGAFMCLVGGVGAFMRERLVAPSSGHGVERSRLRL